MKNSVLEIDNFLIKKFGIKFWHLITKRCLNDNQVEFIINLSNRKNLKSILEIGTYKGYSLALFCSLWPKSNVYSIDIERHKEAEAISSFYKNSKLLIGTSLLVQELNTFFDFILIDGNHSYNQVNADWNNIKDFIIPNDTIIMFDDLNTGAGRAFNNIKINGSKEKFGKFGIFKL